jgi:organic radical activating enzyme
VNKFYCSQKFWWLSVFPERKQIRSCCSADPVKIDLTWLKNNPDKLFNLPELQQERTKMLADQQVPSCYNNCWHAESQGLPSRRTEMQSDQFTHTDINAEPSTLNIVLGNQCNLTCSYCCKEYSTSWLNDIERNGVYFDDLRYNIDDYDIVRKKLNQQDVESSEFYQSLLNSALYYKNLNQVIITGGEPFLYNGLIPLINNLKDLPIQLFTGVGVNPKRFEKILNDIPDYVTLVISAENIGKLYEFNRYGNSYDNFLQNFELVKKKKINYKFSCTLSNLTIHGFKEFQDKFWTENSNIQFVTDPSYLSMNVLDEKSKELINQITYQDNEIDLSIKQSLEINSTSEQKDKLKIFLSEFAKRRQLDLSVFPQNFINWSM